MAVTKADLMMHPVRLQILLALAGLALTTQEIGTRLPDVPQSSIYRHLKTLLDGGLVRVAATRPVKGVEEKVYALAAQPHLGPEDVAGWTPEEHQRAFTTYMLALLQGFRAYLATPGFDLPADRTGYTEIRVFATDAEYDAAIAALNAALLPLATQGPGPGRRQHKIAVITHPIASSETTDDGRWTTDDGQRPD
jgi:DNA-binding transcriptional ArsR family regulator